jgi:mannosyltransferase
MQFKRISISLLLLGIILVGLGLRLYCLTKEDIWYDEAITIKAAKMSLRDMVHFTSSGSHETGFPPVYYLLMKGWITIFGDSPTAVRMSSAICGIFTILAIYGIGRKLFNEPLGLYMALLMAVSPLDIYYSQETRAYALQVLLLCMADYFFILALEKDARGGWYAVTMISAIYIHFFSSFVWFGLFLFHFIYLWNGKKVFSEVIKGLFSQWIILVGIFPLLIVKIMYYSPHLINWVEPFKLSFYRQTLIHLMFGVVKTYTHVMYIAGMSIIALCFAVSLYHLIVVWLQNKSSNPKSPNIYQTGLLAWVLFLGPVLIFTIISLTIHQIYVPWRYLIITLPGFLLLMTQGLSQIYWRPVRILILILLPALCFVSDLRNDRVPQKVGMKSVSEYLQKNSQPSDYVFFIPGYHQESFLYYYHDNIHLLSDKEMENWFESIKEAGTRKQRAWLVLDRGSVSNVEADNVLNYFISVYEKPIQKEILQPYRVEVYFFARKS